MTIFEHKSYKTYLIQRVKDTNTRGILSQLAAAAECQKSYLSKVLQRNSKVQLTPDHLFGICQYLNLDESEAEYLRLLLDLERASNKKYKTAVEKKLSLLRHKYTDLKDQLKKDSLVANHFQNEEQIYYSYWLYAAIHIATSIPEMQSVSALSKRFSVSEDLVLKHLIYLQNLNFVKQVKDRWLWSAGDIHLPKSSFLILFHHMNWRNVSLQDIAAPKPDSLHYSLVQSISFEDYEKLKILLVDWLKGFQKITGPSKPEELIAFNLDFFKVGN